MSGSGMSSLSGECCGRCACRRLNIRSGAPILQQKSGFDDCPPKKGYPINKENILD